jgi:branched-chain amino acid transport system ATP-binding protein
MSMVLEVDSIHTYYGKSHILDGVSLNIREGELVALLGRNGAGKTTTLRSIMGLTPPRQGSIKLFGKDTTGAPAHRAAAAGVGYVPEGRRIFGHLSVHENLLVSRATGTSMRCTSCSPACTSAATARAGVCPAASRKCWPSRAHCCSTPSC